MSDPCPDCGRTRGHRLDCATGVDQLERTASEAVRDDTPHAELDLHPADEARPEWSQRWGRDE